MKTNRILEKYKLIKTFETELSVGKKTFTDEIIRITEKGYYSSLFSFLDIFSKRTKKYIGNVGDKNFIIREKYDFNNFTVLSTTKVKSEFLSQNGRLKINTVIQGMGIFSFVIKIFILVIYILLMLLVIIEILIPPYQTDLDSAYLIPPLFITFITFCLTYLPYRIARRNVIRTKNNIDMIYQLIERTPHNNV